MLSKLKSRGTYKNTCEDALYVSENDNFISGVVSDGCSTGTNSVFASTLICHIVHNTINDSHLATSDYTVRNLIKKLRIAKESFSMNEMNFLATIILFDYDKLTKELWVWNFGDGVIFFNGVKMVFDQDNTPDYLGYHLDEKINSYLMSMNGNFMAIPDVENFSICSDGIDSIELSQFIQELSIDPIERLTSRPTSENYLERQFNILTKKGFKLRDDLSIITYYQDDSAVPEN